MIRIRLSYCLRLILLFSFCLLLLLPPLPYSPLFFVPPVSADAEGWYIEGQPVITKDKDQDNPPCYINRKVTVSDGMGSGIVTYTPECFKESATYYAQVKWTSPPKYLQPGSTVEFSMSANSGGTISQAGGGIKVNNGTLLEVHDRNQPSNKAAYKVPKGASGSKLEIYVSFIACGLHGYVTYNYIYKGAATTTAPVAPVAPAVKTAPAANEGWYLDGAPVHEDPGVVDGDCIFVQEWHLSDGDAFVVIRTKDCNSKVCSSEYVGRVRWKAFPAFMQPDSDVNFQISKFSDSVNDCGNSSFTSSGLIKAEGTQILETREGQEQELWGCNYKVPRGSLGDRLKIRALATIANVDLGMTYNYVYDTKAHPPAASYKPSHDWVTESPIYLTVVKEGLAGQKSDFVIERVGGSVKIIYPGDDIDSWQYAKGGEIPWGAQILTEEDSYIVLIHIHSGTTIKLGAESNLTLPVPKVKSQWDLVMGRAWANIKHIAKGEPIEFRTVHTAIGIRGTTLVCENTGTQSTTKVLEGTVTVSGRADDKEITVQSGEMITATGKGLGGKTKFDVNSESNKWSKIGDSTSSSQSASSSSSESSTTRKKIKIGPLSCFIATAAYGSETAAELDTLRSFRDRVLMQSGPGRWFVDTYYKVSPPLAEYIAEHEDVRTFVREAFLNHVVYLLKGSQEVWNH